MMLPSMDVVGQLPRRALMLLVRAYRLLLQPWLGNACRFEPTCSSYALAALQRHGAFKGSLLTGGRLLRCHPWCEAGCDPVPERWPRRSTGSAGSPGTSRASTRLFTRFGSTAADDSSPSAPKSLP